MKLFDQETAGPVDEAAQLWAETGIRTFRLLRRTIREDARTTLAPSQLRALAYLDENPGGCLSDLAEFLLVGPPTASKVVDELVGRRLVSRTVDAGDRRKVTLRLTARGGRALRTAARPGQERLAALLAGLPADELERVRSGLEALLPLLGSARVEADA